MQRGIGVRGVSPNDKDNRTDTHRDLRFSHQGNMQDDALIDGRKEGGEKMKLNSKADGRQERTDKPQKRT
jgi:hypothetical protein